MPHGVHLLLEIDCWSSAVVRIGSASALNKGACFFTYNEVSICWEGVCVCVCVLLCVLCVHYPAADLCNVEGFSVNTFPWWKGVDPSLFLPHLHSSFTPSTGIEQRHQSAVSAALEFPLFSDKNRASPLWAGTFGGGEAITHQGRFSLSAVQWTLLLFDMLLTEQPTATQSPRLLNVSYATDIVMMPFNLGTGLCSCKAPIAGP